MSFCSRKGIRQHSSIWSRRFVAMSLVRAEASRKRKPGEFSRLPDEFTDIGYL